jgi:hypothetical protein
VTGEPGGKGSVKERQRAIVRGSPARRSTIGVQDVFDPKNHTIHAMCKCACFADTAKPPLSLLSLKDSLAEGAGKKRQIEKSGQGIVPGKNGRLQRSSQ